MIKSDDQNDDQLVNEEERYERLSTGPGVLFTILMMKSDDQDDSNESNDDHYDNSDENYDDYDENNDGKIIVQFSALVEKVEVDLLNKDDDNYKREVLHSVKVLLLLVI